MTNFEVLILGGGPAGLTAARRLAALGRKVAVFSRPAGPRTPFSRVETIPSLAVMCEAFPEFQGDEQCGVSHSAVAGTSWWTGIERRTPPMLVVERTVLENKLTEKVIAAGARVFFESPDRTTLTRRRNCWIVQPLGLTARILIDATGRNSTFRRREFMVPWRQVALIGEWNNAVNAPDLWTESFPEGWLWGIHGSGGRFTVFLFMDAAEARCGRQTIWANVLTRSRLAPLFTRWRRPARIFTREVTPVALKDSTDHEIIHIGDAALARDPLASQGLMAALSDGLCGAVAAHTVLNDNSKWELVEGFLGARQRRSRVDHLRLLRETYSLAPFTERYWAERGDADQKQAATSPLRVTPESLLVMSPEWFVGYAPTANDTEIILSTVFQRRESDESVAWLNKHPIWEYLKTAQWPCTARALALNWVSRNLASERGAVQLIDWFANRSILVLLSAENAPSGSSSACRWR